MLHKEVSAVRGIVDVDVSAGRDAAVYIGKVEITAKVDEEDYLYIGVPPMPNYFVGRDEVVAQMVTRLLSGNHQALSAEGMAGVGKTALAVALAHHRDILKHFKDGVLWAGLGQQPDVMRVFARWSRALVVDISGMADAAEQVQIVQDAVSQRQLLIVLDDVWDEESIRFFRFGSPNCAYLLTTRDQSIARTFAGPVNVMRVSELDTAPAHKFLQELAPEACAADPSAARDLVKAVGGLPLAVELLGGYLAAPERSYFPDLSEYALSELGDTRQRLQLAQQRLGDVKDKKLTLHETIGLSLENLPQPGVEAFYAFGVFASKPESFDRSAAEIVTGANVSILALLIARNLVQQIDDSWLAMHQVLSDVAREKSSREQIESHREYYLGRVCKVSSDA